MLLRTSGKILATPLDMIKFWLSTNGTKKNETRNCIFKHDICVVAAVQ